MDNQWKLEIIRVRNGYKLNYPQELDDSSTVIQEEVIEDGPGTANDPQGEIESGEKLLWFILEYFALLGSKHDPERLVIRREKHE
jgi:hypothetical protein